MIKRFLVTSPRPGVSSKPAFFAKQVHHLWAGLLIVGVLVLAGAKAEASDDKIYWTDSHTNKIQRSNLDGSGVEDVLTGLGSPRGIAIDDKNEKVYWAEFDTGLIRCANLDGTNVQTVVAGLIGPKGIALDCASGKIYWADHQDRVISRASLDGSMVEDVADHSGAGVDFPTDVAIDPVSFKMYWTQLIAFEIKRSNLDGSGVENLLDLPRPEGIALDPAGGKMYWTDFEEGTVHRANLDGSAPEFLVSVQGNLKGIVLDVPKDKMYFVNDSPIKNNAILRANLDGSGLETLVTNGLVTPKFIDLGSVSLHEVRAGNVNSVDGPTTDVLFLNGSAGSGPDRMITIDTRVDPFLLQIDDPPSRTGAKYVIYVWNAEPTDRSRETLPSGVGDIALPTPLTGNTPSAARIANNLHPQLGADNWYREFSPALRTPYDLIDIPPGGVRVSGIKIYIQGIIQDTASPSGVVAVTNGILVDLVP